MPKRFNCPLSEAELRKAYIEDGRTLKEMCDYIGVKSPVTVSKILTEKGIEVIADKKSARARLGLSKDDFKKFLEAEYATGKSMGDIGIDLGISPSAVRGLFERYEIGRRSNTDFLKRSPELNPNWHGGRRLSSGGYIEIYCPDHPNANNRKCVYEHQLVVEQHIGRYLLKDEVVHHLDGNKSNNDISNLILLTNPEHARLHAILRRGQKRMNNKF